MCITPTKASDISEILQKKRNMDTCFIRLRENIMNFAADFKFKIVLRMKKSTNYPSPFFSIFPIVILVVLLYLTIGSFGSDALSGAGQVCLLIATAHIPIRRQHLHRACATNLFPL